MRRKWIFLAAVIVGAMAIGACGGDGGEASCSDTTCLRDALANAKSGDTVQLESGTYSGNFEVPAGVALKGSGGTTVLTFEGDAPVLSVSAEGGGVTLSELTIQKPACPFHENPGDVAGSGGGGIYVRGAGPVVLTNLNVDVSCGLGILVSDATTLEATNLVLSGNVTENDSPGMEPVPNKTLFAVAGLVLDGVGEATLGQVEASGFGSVGVLLNDSATTWDIGTVHSLVGAGVHAAGSVTVTLKTLTIHDIWGGATPFGYGIAATNGVNLVTENVTVEDNAVAGVLLDSATGDLLNLTARNNGTRGVWVQNCQPKERALTAVSVKVHGTATTLDGNSGVAFGVFQSSGVIFQDATVSNTHKIPMSTWGEGGRVDIGDGIEIVSSDHLEFTDLTLDCSERAGVVLDASEMRGEVDVTFVNVQITGAGDRGYVLQGGAAATAPTVVEQELINADAIGGDLDVATPFDPGLLPDAVGIIEIPE